MTLRSPRREARSAVSLSAVLLLAALPSVSAGCTQNDQGYYDCDGGLSWNARAGIIAGCAVAFVIVTMIAVFFIRRAYRRRQAALPGVKNGQRYDHGQYWEQRQADLPGFQPPTKLLSVASRTEPRWVIEDPNLSRAVSTEHGRQLVHHARPQVGVSRITSRTSGVSEAMSLPTYEKSVSIPTKTFATSLQSTPPGSPGVRASFDSQRTLADSPPAFGSSRPPKIEEEA